MKKTWKGIREIINTKSSMSYTSQINHNGLIINEPIIIANTFNNFFTSIGKTLDKSIPQTKINALSYLKNKIEIDFTAIPTTNEEVQKIISSLDDSKSSGPLSIPIKLLKIAAPLIIQPLTDLINISFETGSFPDKIKIAIVIPVHKSGSKLDVNNYRPIFYFLCSVKSLKKSCMLDYPRSSKSITLYTLLSLVFKKINLPYTHLLKLLKKSDHVLKTRNMVVMCL